MTVAHELGHGLHGCLSRKQSYFNYDTPLTTAETASVFGEMLVFDHLVEHPTDSQAQIALLAGKIEDIFATVFRQNVLTRFEEASFTARKERRLTPDLLGALWIEANVKYYGDAVEMPEGYRWGWSYSSLHPLALLLLQLRFRPASGACSIGCTSKDKVSYRNICLLEARWLIAPKRCSNRVGRRHPRPKFWQKDSPRSVRWSKVWKNGRQSVGAWEIGPPTELSVAQPL
jgi:hypothetical protein